MESTKWEPSSSIGMLTFASLQQQQQQRRNHVTIVSLFFLFLFCATLRGFFRGSVLGPVIYDLLSLTWTWPKDNRHELLLLFALFYCSPFLVVVPAFCLFVCLFISLVSSFFCASSVSYTCAILQSSLAMPSADSLLCISNTRRRFFWFVFCLFARWRRDAFSLSRRLPFVLDGRTDRRINKSINQKFIKHVRETTPPKQDNETNTQECRWQHLNKMPSRLIDFRPCCSAWYFIKTSRKWCVVVCLGAKTGGHSQLDKIKKSTTTTTAKKKRKRKIIIRWFIFIPDHSEY